MKILGHLDRFGPPVGGGVITTIAILQELAHRGHEVTIVTNRSSGADMPGITSYEAAGPEALNELYRTADLVAPHMTATPTAMEYVRRFGTPVLYPVHDDGQLERYELIPDEISIAVFNSHGLMERTAWPGEQTVVHPPIWIEDHRVEHTGEAITIASLSAEKGGETFWKLVKRFPDRQFIGVMGGWGDQNIPDPLPANVEIMGHQGETLRDVFSKTRLLLVPSQRLDEGERYWTENWGRAAIEAAASGIPTIANPAPGPVEALANAGIFCDRNDVDAWAAAIEELDDSAAYERQSTLVYQRARELETIVSHQLDELNHRLVEVSLATRAGRFISLD